MFCRYCFCDLTKEQNATNLLLWFCFCKLLKTQKLPKAKTLNAKSVLIKTSVFLLFKIYKLDKCLAQILNAQFSVNVEVIILLLTLTETVTLTLKSKNDF